MIWILNRIQNTLHAKPNEWNSTNFWEKKNNQNMGNQQLDTQLIYQIIDPCRWEPSVRNDCAIHIAWVVCIGQNILKSRAGFYDNIHVSAYSRSGFAINSRFKFDAVLTAHNFASQWFFFVWSQREMGGSLKFNADSATMFSIDNFSVMNVDKICVCTKCKQKCEQK